MTDTPQPDETPLTGEVLVPYSGELLALDADSETLVDAVYRMRELEDELRRVRQTVGLELTRRLDAENLRSVKVGEYDLKVAAPRDDWPIDDVDAVLAELVEAETITQGARDRVVKSEPKLDLRELKKLLGTLPDDARDRLRSVSTRSTRLRSVTVKAKA